jgi:hypothetical protein
MSDQGPVDLLIMLEIVRYLRVREERASANSLEAQLFNEVLANLPPGVSLEALVKQEVVMGDRYEVNQAGAVGPSSVAIGQHFTQIWQKASPEIDLNQLAQELRAVRERARALSSGAPEEDVAMAEVANAELAAQDGNGPRALSHLAKAGAWILDVARQIGVPVAIGALESTLS